jgi:hypothetical protein
MRLHSSGTARQPLFIRGEIASSCAKLTLWPLYACATRSIQDLCHSEIAAHQDINPKTPGIHEHVKHHAKIKSHGEGRGFGEVNSEAATIVLKAPTTISTEPVAARHAAIVFQAIS